MTPTKTLVRFDSSQLLNCHPRPESVRIVRSIGRPNFHVAQTFTGPFGWLTRVLNRESVGRKRGSTSEPWPATNYYQFRFIASAVCVHALTREGHIAVRCLPAAAGLRKPDVGFEGGRRPQAESGTAAATRLGKNRPVEIVQTRHSTRHYSDVIQHAGRLEGN
jgi:hypothetical protein